jgi:glycosyltransferase involved in cell wall biosynthesis
MNRFPENWPKVKTALCHDWLTGMRGGERVLEILCEGFLAAEIHTLIANRDAVSEIIKAHPIQTSWLQGMPGVFERYRSMLPLFPMAVRNLRPDQDTELLVSTSHCVAKSIRTAPGTRHLCYCFTPMRYAWTFYDEYFGSNPLKAAVAKPLLASLRRWDKKTAARVDRFVAISHHVQKRIKDFYGRESDVVYPPVDTERCTPSDNPGQGGFDLIVSAMVPYKRLDLAIAAYNRLGYPLKVVGVGGQSELLRKTAADNIEFLGWQTDDDILELYRSCRMLIFPGEEDFGIVPLEAQACGRPVVAYGCGGALETVADGVSGLFFAEQTPECLADAVERCAARKWDPAAIRANAEKFDTANFITGLAASMQKCLADNEGC